MGAAIWIAELGAETTIPSRLVQPKLSTVRATES
jgi:hypothetical protein